MEFDDAVLNGSAGIALPTLVSTLAICSVFVSVFFLQGAARYLLHAARHGRRLCDADLLHPVAHTHADHHPHLAAQRAGAACRGAFLVVQPLSRRVQREVRQLSRGLHLRAGACAGKPHRRAAHRALCHRRRSPSRDASWLGFLPAGRYRPDPASRPCPGAHPYRSDRGDIPGGRGPHPSGYSRQKSGPDPR